MHELLGRAAAAAADYRSALPGSRVGATAAYEEARASFGGALPEGPSRPEDVLDDLVAAAGPGLVATAGPRYFGFVIGGSLPAATAAEVVAAGWDQVAFNSVLSPAAAAAEEVAGGWLKSLLGLPPAASVGFVTGGQAANTVGLAAARHKLLADAGWDVESAGLGGAPGLRILAGAERHATIDRAVRLLGLGTAALEPVATDGNGAIEVGDLERVLGRGGSPAIVCAQAGNVNTGACDDLRGVCEVARRHGAWVHVDGAFGLWAAASRSLRHLVDGVELADSWACDGHKWLNVPYDAGYAFCAHPRAHASAVSYTAAYLVGQGDPGVASPSSFTLESSRRARGFATWAAIRELGRSGVDDLVTRCCALARRFASGLQAAGATIANDVVLNQVLVGFGDDRRTDAVIREVQADGTCWVGGTTWRGVRLMRISVCNHSTTAADVDLSVEAITRAAATV